MGAWCDGARWHFTHRTHASDRAFARPPAPSSDLRRIPAARRPHSCLCSPAHTRPSPTAQCRPPQPSPPAWRPARCVIRAHQAPPTLLLRAGPADHLTPPLPRAPCSASSSRAAARGGLAVRRGARRPHGTWARRRSGRRVPCWAPPPQPPCCCPPHQRWRSLAAAVSRGVWAMPDCGDAKPAMIARACLPAATASRLARPHRPRRRQRQQPGVCRPVGPGPAQEQVHQGRPAGGQPAVRRGGGPWCMPLARSGGRARGGHGRPEAAWRSVGCAS